MDLKTLHIAPFSEGFIRVASSVNAAGKSQFNGTIEVLSRHHSIAESQAEGETETAIPRLATHPISAALLTDVDTNKKASKLVEIPVKLFFNKTRNAITAKYQAYDNCGRPVCAGDGENAIRRDSAEGGIPVSTKTPCIGSEACAFANSGAASCRRQVSMTVQVKGQENPLSVFEVRTSSYNSYKALRGQLELIEHRFGGLRHVPLKLQLWKSSNEASDYEAFDLLKLNLDASTEAEAMRQAKKAREEETELGLQNDHDATFEALKATDLLDQQTDDISLVSDFYRTTPSKTSSRRTGGKSEAARAIAGEAKESAKSITAADFISNAVKGAARNTAPTVEEATQ